MVNQMNNVSRFVGWELYLAYEDVCFQQVPMFETFSTLEGSDGR